jgi:hypothetical protein
MGREGRRSSREAAAAPSGTICSRGQRVSASTSAIAQPQEEEEEGAARGGLRRVQPARHSRVSELAAAHHWMRCGAAVRVQSAARHERAARLSAVRELAAAAGHPGTLCICGADEVDTPAEAAACAPSELGDPEQLPPHGLRTHRRDQALQLEAVTGDSCSRELLMQRRQCLTVMPSTNLDILRRRASAWIQLMGDGAAAGQAGAREAMRISLRWSILDDLARHGW